MRILFISAFYPPHVVGGWEQLVQDINHHLRQRGHQTAVLTSRYGVAGPVVDEDVHRVLHLESDVQHYQPGRFLFHARDVDENIEHTRTVIRDFRPDIVFVHVMWNLTRAVPWTAEQMLPEKVVYYIAGDWPYAPDAHTAYWQNGANRGLAAALKRLVAPVPLALSKRAQQRYALEFEHVLCVSQAMKDQLARRAGIPEAQMQVVYNGVELDRFHPRTNDPDKAATAPPLSLVYAGTIAPHKGVHTAVEAMALLRIDPPRRDIHLTILGSGQQTYEQYLREIVARSALDGHVTFRSRVARQEMPRVLREFDALLLPSIWEEPLSRLMQEAMASGLVVLGTNTGGTGELLIDGETGLVFPRGDAAALADRIRRIAGDPGLARSLAQGARETVIERFSLTRMIDEIEDSLHKVANRAPVDAGQ